MSWNKQRIDDVAIRSAQDDYLAFEAIGLSELDNARVLDVGCFDGFNTLLKFAPYANIGSVTGIDPAEDAVTAARNGAEDNRFRWHVSSCERFDAPSDSFDVAYFAHSLQHLQDKREGLANTLRMLKPGGFIVIKTTDDSLKVSYPDPDESMARLFDLYEEHILPRVAHTAHTDRNLGHKCYSLLAQAGFTNIAVRTTQADTVGKTLEQRLALFERCSYFRRASPVGVDPAVLEQRDKLLDSWGELFKDDNYYFSTCTYIAIAQKPSDTGSASPYHGPLFGQLHTYPRGEQSGAGSSNARKDIARDAGLDMCIRPMLEEDLGAVMSIEMASFPDPWTPVAYAMELRYNTRGHYLVRQDSAMRITGYIGWWDGGEVGTIANVAVDPNIRRSGTGSALVQKACLDALESGCKTMQLQVRANNSTARSFYKALGFIEIGLSASYYANPDDDAVIMQKPLTEDLRG